jgi:hypothetical protein
MKSFVEFLDEAVKDVHLLKRKPLSQRTEKDQAAINAAKSSKPKTGKVDIHLKHEDGSTSKSTFKLTKSQDKWEDEAKSIAANHLKQMQNIHDQFPKISGSRAKEVHKATIK